MSPRTRSALFQAAAIGAMTVAGAGKALAAEAPLLATELPSGAAKVELIDNSRLGCAPSFAGVTTTFAGRCSFDNATRGAKITAKQAWSEGSFEAYATVAHATAGAFTPDQLLVAPKLRSSEATDLLVFGLKGSAFDNRIKVTTEFASTKQVVDELIRRDWALADSATNNGTSAMARIEAKLVSSPRFNWSMTAEYRSASEAFVSGRSNYSLYSAMPGTRMALSSRARLGALGLDAGIERTSRSYGDYGSIKAGIDLYGVSLRLVDRDVEVRPFEGSSLTGSRTRSTSTYIDLDTATLAMSLLPDVGDLPWLVPTQVSMNLRSGQTENRYSDGSETYGRSSLGVDGTWETPIGETVLSYWRDGRIGLTDGTQSRTDETFQLSHYVRRGPWRFGLDASLVRGRGDGSDGYGERSWSFGQSVAYSTPDGPEFRLSLGQDRSAMRRDDASFAYADRYSQITASLDLSRYLQKRFERPDLRLTLDYRRAVDRSDSETQLFDELVERWTDGERRQGLLMSFGMKL